MKLDASDVAAANARAIEEARQAGSGPRHLDAYLPFLNDRAAERPLTFRPLPTTDHNQA
jgi:hypothetical protein